MKRKDAYLNALQEVMTDTAPTKPSVATLAELEISEGILSKRLLGPMSNPERIWAIEDRREIRKQIAALRAAGQGGLKP
jgi:hypothetical protein